MYIGGAQLSRGFAKWLAFLTLLCLNVCRADWLTALEWFTTLRCLRSPVGSYLWTALGLMETPELGISPPERGSLLWWLLGIGERGGGGGGGLTRWTL